MIVQGNFLGVVAPSEWDAIQAAKEVTASTQWTSWKGLPGHEKLFDHLRQKDWAHLPVMTGAANKGRRRQRSRRKLQRNSLPEARADRPGGRTRRGSGGRHGHRAYEHPEPAIPAQGNCDRVSLPDRQGRHQDLCGLRPLRPIERRQRRPWEIRRCSSRRRWAGPSVSSGCEQKTCSGPHSHPPCTSTIRIALDANGRVVGYQGDHFGPPMQSNRLLGAVLAGLPTMGVPTLKAPAPHQGELLVRERLGLSQRAERRGARSRCVPDRPA